IKKLILYNPLRSWISSRRHDRKFIEWERNGRPVPPPHIVKQRTLRTFAKRFNLKIMVETGTFYGDMVEAMKEDFDRIYSIELSKELYEKAKKRFEDEEKIQLIQGDSGIELGNLINRIDGPALFWLDGHYSAGVTAKGSKYTPIYEELTHIFEGTDKRHVIIIDDARCFGTDSAYPSIEELSNFIKSNLPDSDVTVEDDSIRIVPRSMSEKPRHRTAY
ncbi:MAG: hypothetical protein KJ882_11750, partial [Proteobacteria bacterium]|nr:hypothetical protein [Pseudomonadota bacterium]